MTLRWLVVPVCAIVFSITTPAVAAERYTTRNFVVEAATKELAKTFGDYAEQYRKEKALDWLGYIMPDWPRPCPLKVQVTMANAGGATTFTFGPGQDGRSTVLSQEMKIFGEVNQLLRSVLPHEITHTVLAHHFGQAVPRWADEGGSVLSENDEERFNHDVRCREILNQGRGIPLRHLFQMTEYPRDMIVVYAQGYSVCQYLIDQGGKQKFLQFVALGMRNSNRNWEEAVQMYGYNDTEELQVAWLKELKAGPPQRISARVEGRPAATRDRSGPTRPSATLASNNRNVETRSSAIPGLPQLEPPVVARGAAPERESKTTKAPPAVSPPLPRLGPPEPPVRK